MGVDQQSEKPLKIDAEMFRKIADQGKKKRKVTVDADQAEADKKAAA